MVKIIAIPMPLRTRNCRDYAFNNLSFIVDDIFPPLCHELWHSIYPSVYTLLNGGALDYGETRIKFFDKMS